MSSRDKIKKAVDGMLGEGLHTAFRKASEHPSAHRIWKEIQTMPTDDWLACLDFVAAPLTDEIMRVLEINDD